MSELRTTIELDIPLTAAERIAEQARYACVNCGTKAEGLKKPCDCATMCGWRSVNGKPHYTFFEEPNGEFSEQTFRKHIAEIGTKLEQERAKNAALVAALKGIIAADDEFRAALPSDWDRDPLADEVDKARAALKLAGATP